MELPRSIRVLSAALAVAGAVVAAPAGQVAAAGRRRPAPAPVIAVTESGGINLFHEDFRTRDGRSAALPPAARSAKVVHLPTSGSFHERVAAARKGPLGDLEQETLYYVAGTRLLLYVPRDVDGYDLFADMEHPTGTASSAAGLEHGTNPDALLLYVPASIRGWEWMHGEPWIDVISASYYTLVSPQDRCGPNRHIRKIAGDGRIVFTAAGNVEQAGIVSSPAGAVGAYQVGGVDSEGRPYSPASSVMAPTVGTAPTRPYETGDRMEFPAAAHDAVSGSQAFGGTSGAAPSTAGRATLLLQHAQRILGSKGGGVVDGKLARAARGVSLPARGPLADGDLTGAELTELLHHTAIPYTPPSPLRYYAEGYGALNDDAIDRAKLILEGREAAPERPEDDAQHAQWEGLREDVFQAACT